MATEARERGREAGRRLVASGDAPDAFSGFYVSVPSDETGENYKEFEGGFGEVTLADAGLREKAAPDGRDDRTEAVLAGWTKEEAVVFATTKGGGIVYTRGVDNMKTQPCPFWYHPLDVPRDYDHIPIDAIAAWRVGADGQVARGMSTFTA